ncbi:hypothetical protein FSARC_1870 [Fusarium sarcochroum]|uniref:Uncharacterized protein n=1 Tax=Fusarium sarcochroum TaxID=1208366 RepID=A0A8H4U7K2_9HYPO|nr:hypothetical protein FSARC_1870 [Fusarium sarcochroum]
MEHIGLLSLEPNIHVESYNDILSERVLSCLMSEEITISLPGCESTPKDGCLRERGPERMAWPKDFQRGLQDAKSLIDGLCKKPKVLLKADNKRRGVWPEEYNLIIDMAKWDKTRTIDEGERAAGPKTIGASLIWRMMMYETVQAATTNEITLSGEPAG